MECRRAGRGLPVLLEGGPLDGVEETIPMLAAGVMALPDLAGRRRRRVRLLLCADRQRHGGGRVDLPVQRAAGEGV